MQLKEELEWASGAFEGDTIYRADYSRHQPMIVQMTRPETQLKVKNKMDLQSTYNENFHAKEKLPQVTFSELPSFTYSILYPNREQPVDKTSFKNFIHSGTTAPKSEMCKPKESTIQIGTEGDRDHSTTHRSTFKQPPNISVNRVKTMGSSLDLKPRKKFIVKSQAQDDYKGFGAKMPLPRKIITPPPETLEIAMNDKRYFDTTNRSEIKISWDPKGDIRDPPVKHSDNYSLPKGKFDGLSITGQDFKEHKNIHPSVLKRPEEFQMSDSKFSGETSYQKAFANYGPIKRVRYGDFHEGNLYLKPVAKFHQDGSVMQQDYHLHKDAKPRSPKKPDYRRHDTGGNFNGITNYNEDYKAKDTKPCQFSKLMAEMDLKKKKLAFEPKKRTLPEVNRKGSTVAAV